MSDGRPSWLRPDDVSGESAESGGNDRAADPSGSDRPAESDEQATGGEPGDEPSLNGVRSALIEWYESDHRSFPWRETTEPYPILVSEVMSQQTQLDRVESAYEDFLDRWPTVEQLAADDRSAVVAFWSDHSLGYNNRAKYLHEAAQQVIEEYDGEFPHEPAELEELMGVGPYTANAVASFAFNTGNAVVDTNVKRVLHRAFDVPDDDAAFESAAGRLMPDGDSRTWNNAIMELGGVACGQRPNCDTEPCPWRDACHAYHTGDFTAPDVPEQPDFEGSRRQFRGRVIDVLGAEAMPLDTLGHRIRVDYAPDGEYGREWLRGLVADLVDDGLVETVSRDDQPLVRLRE